MVSGAEDDPLSNVEREFLNASVRTAPREDGQPPARFDLRPFSMGRFDVRSSAPKASDALAVIGRRRSRRLFDDANARELADVLYFGARVRDFWKAPDGFLASSRPAPSAGGRHPVEIFVLSNRVRGLDSGVWWFDAFQSALELVPLERFRSAVNARAAELLGGKVEQDADSAAGPKDVNVEHCDVIALRTVAHDPRCSLHPNPIDLQQPVAESQRLRRCKRVLGEEELRRGDSFCALAREAVVNGTRADEEACFQCAP